MKRVRFLLVAAVLAAIIVVVLVVRGGPDTAQASEFAGIVANDVYFGSPSYQEKQFAAMEAAGIHSIRQTLPWADVEVAPNSYDFTKFDQFVEGAARHHIRVLPLLFDPPPFYRPKGSSTKYTPFPTSNSAMAAFAAAVASRYGRTGSFWDGRTNIPKLPFTAYQVWNEPNLKAYSGGRPGAAKYVAMLKAVGPAIKTVDPQAEIVTAGLPDSRLSQPNVYKFIQQMYSAGAKGTFDTLGVNPYAPTATGLISKLKRIRGIMARNGNSRARLWVTELGWSDVGPSSPFRAGKSGQATRIRQALAALKRNAATLKLRGFFYFAWKDGPVYRGGHDFWGLHTGLLRKNGTPKAAFAAFKQAVAKL